jgi:hypothetical protein
MSVPELPPRDEAIRSFRTIDLARDHGALLERAVQMTDAGLPWSEYLRAPEVSEVEPLCVLVGTILRSDRGIALLRIGEGMSDDAMRLLVLLIGRGLGRNVVPTVGADPRPLFAITATDDPTIGGAYAGNGRNSRSLALHTDGSGIHSASVDILGMLCIRPAAEGGVSRFADALDVHSQLTEESRIMLSRSLPRTDPYNPSLPGDQLSCRPVFDRGHFSYHPQRLRDGTRVRDGGVIAPSLERAFAELDAALDHAAFEVPLRRGDVVLLDNRVIAHGRTAFFDTNPPRLIERLWIEAGS